MSQAAPLAGCVWVIAHRGASWDAPEHTVPAYDRAVADGTDYLEVDLWQAGDGALVCIHDPTVDRTSDGTGAVAILDTGELRRLDSGSWFNSVNPDRARAEYAGARVVLFDEMLARYKELDHIRFYVETKHAYLAGREAGAIDPALEHELVRLLGRHELVGTDRVVVQSFWPASLKSIKDLTGDAVPVALLSPGPGPAAVPSNVEIVAPAHRALLGDLGYIDRIHAQGAAVHTWTVDDPGEMRALISAGIDGIFTNRPAVLRRLLEAEFPQWSAGDPARRATQP